MTFVMLVEGPCGNDPATRASWFPNGRRMEMARHGTRGRRRHDGGRVRLCKRCGIEFNIEVEDNQESEFCPACMDELISEEHEEEDGNGWESPPYGLLEA